MLKPKVCVLRTAGTNCDQETAAAFKLAGARAELCHINNILENPGILKKYQALAFPGGFSYGDDIASGKIFANELKFKLAGEIEEFIKQGKLIIGICNGFQILVKSGFLPGNLATEQNASLIINDSGKFEDRWVYLKPSGKSVWTKEIKEIIYLPVAHGEGKFIVQNKSLLKELEKRGQVVFRYCTQSGGAPVYPDDPNGSIDHIAGITDETGRILGLMPHPERHVFSRQHPRQESCKTEKFGQGLRIFKNGVEYLRKKL